MCIRDRPSTARRGVFAAEAGMLLAVVGTLLYHGIVEYKWIAIALVIGSIVGVPLGEVAMTAVPQRTALSHAFGACCVTLVGTAEFYLRTPNVPLSLIHISNEREGYDNGFPHGYLRPKTRMIDIGNCTISCILCPQR